MTFSNSVILALVPSTSDFLAKYAHMMFCLLSYLYISVSFFRLNGSTENWASFGPLSRRYTQLTFCVLPFFFSAGGLSFHLDEKEGLSIELTSFRSMSPWTTYRSVVDICSDVQLHLVTGSNHGHQGLRGAYTRRLPTGRDILTQVQQTLTRHRATQNWRLQGQRGVNSTVLSGR